MKKEGKKSVAKGIIGITSKGTGYVTSAGFDMDIQIEPQFLNTALHGDEVEFFVFPQIEKERLDGEIIRVLWRAKMELAFFLSFGWKRDCIRLFLFPPPSPDASATIGKFLYGS